MSEEMREMKAWKCPSGHALGITARNGSGIRQLLLYRQAVDMEQSDEAPDVMAVAEGLVMDVRCSICGSVRTWVPGQESLDRLLKRVNPRLSVEEQRA